MKSESEWKHYLEQLDHVLRRGGSRIKEIIFNGGEPTIISWFNSFCEWILLDKKWMLTVYTNLTGINELCKLPRTYRLIIRGSFHPEQANPIEFAHNWNFLHRFYRIEVGELGKERQLEKYIGTPKRTILKPYNDEEIQENRADTLRVGPDQAIYLTCWGVSKANLKLTKL